jgi:regulator of protease activity HflC (stomatin/prohibitin superfamily)
MTTEAQEILRDRDVEIQKIQGYADLTEEAKDRRIAEVTERAQAEYAEAREAESRRIEENVISSKKAVFGIPASPAYSDVEVAQVHAAFRSAWADVTIATANPASAQKELGEILEQAERTGDSLLARAAYHRGLDLGLQPIVDRYLQSRPKEAKALERYTKATEEANQAKDISSLFSQALTERALQSSW